MNESLVTAANGWRVVLADRENGGSVALPIIAWVNKPPYLDCYYAPNECGCPPQLLGDNALLLGYLRPGDEHEAFWGEVGDSTIKALNDQEERDYQRRIRDASA